MTNKFLVVAHFNICMTNQFLALGYLNIFVTNKFLVVAYFNISMTNQFLTLGYLIICVKKNIWLVISICARQIIFVGFPSNFFYQMSRIVGVVICDPSPGDKPRGTT